MKFYRIIDKDGLVNLINLQRVFFVDFKDEEKEIIFDDIIKVGVKESDYNTVRKDLLKKMF